MPELERGGGKQPQTTHCPVRKLRLRGHRLGGRAHPITQSNAPPIMITPPTHTHVPARGPYISATVLWTDVFIKYLLGVYLVSITLLGAGDTKLNRHVLGPEESAQGRQTSQS